MMKRRRILWQLFPSYLLVTFLSVVAIAWYGIQAQRDLYMEESAEALESRAFLIQNQFVDFLANSDTAGINGYTVQLGERSSTRITIILPDGTVIADTEEDPATMNNHNNRPEIIEAYQSGTGIASRYSNTLKKTMLYLALRLEKDGQLLGILRISIPLKMIEEGMNNIRFRMIISGLVIAILAAIVSLLVSRRISRPLEKLKEGATRFADGDLTQRLDVSPIEEIGGLAEAMNSMASQLYQRINIIAEQQREKEAILSSMSEGVIAVDVYEKIIGFNDVAGNFFDVDPSEIEGMILHEAVRNASLIKLIGEILRDGISSDTEIIIESEFAKRILMASGSILKDVAGQAIGAVVVLNDITRLREIEILRRDFVANASHELRTPITAIKGYMETILDDTEIDPDDLKRFLDIIFKHTNRLNAIVGDLLSLSSLEQGPEISFEENKMSDIIASAVDSCAIAIQNKNTRMEISCPQDLKCRVNAPLLELAIANIIDNAVKYSAPNTNIKISAEIKGGNISISVTDEGKGIAPELQHRIFERFYRVDKARSRDSGGTGLGLAIVKHIVLSHRGRIEVDSQINRGSTFSIYIPC